MGTHSLVFVSFMLSAVKNQKQPPEMLCEESVHRISQNSQKNARVRVSFLIKLQSETCNFIKKETLALVFSCEFCEIFKNNFFTEHFTSTQELHSKTFSGNGGFRYESKSLGCQWCWQFCLSLNQSLTLLKKWSFPLRISSS